MLTPRERETLIDRAKGCLLGGALGDALGAPVEFMNWSAIQQTYGSKGIRELDTAYGRVGAITDDTQMTLFSAEGLIRAKVRAEHKGVCSPASVIGYAYQRWLSTQGERCHPFALEELGWLATHSELYARRAPGMTCLASLRDWDATKLEAKNDSKGCGTVMRSAPFGFGPEPWQTAWDAAALTHGHLEAKASAAVFAVIIERIVAGDDLRRAVMAGIQACDFACRTADLLAEAFELSASKTYVPEAIASLGEGWIAEEALAIGAYCALKSPDDFEIALIMAVNHSGDSDSTGSICGNLLGALHGTSVLPERWLEELELREVIEELAADLVAEIPRAADGDVESLAAEEAFVAKYPGA